MSATEIIKSDPTAAPGRLATLAATILEHAYNAREALGAARYSKADALWISGREKTTGETVRTFYFGSQRSLDHIIDRLYDEHSVERRESKLRAWTVNRHVRLAQASADLLIVDLPWPYSRFVREQGFIRVPGWVIQEVKLPAAWDDVVAGFRKNTRTTDLRKIRKFKLSYRLTNDLQEIDRFYESMYAPYAVHRFGKLVALGSREEIARAAKRGALLQVMEGKRAVAGVIVMPRRLTMHFLWFGLPLDLEEPIADAALSGLYYFSLQHAHRQKCAELHLSYTLPLLNDGVYRYKRKWGARIREGWDLEEILLRPMHLKPSLSGFFANQPLIARENKQLVGRILLTAPVTAEDVEKVLDSYVSPGLQRMDLYSLCKIDPAIRAAKFGDDVVTRLIDLSTERDPLAVFTKR